MSTPDSSFKEMCNVRRRRRYDKEANGDPSAKGEIDLSEWDNLFASGFMDFHSLSRTVKALGKEEASFLLQRAKTFKAGYGSV